LESYQNELVKENYYFVYCKIIFIFWIPINPIHKSGWFILNLDEK